MNITEIETLLSVRLPDPHRASLLDGSDPIHKACAILVPHSPYELLRLYDTNVHLHHKDHPDRWPDFLVAFASNGCGDYFAYDTRRAPYLIVYIDPDNTVEENLEMDDDYTFESFAAWYDAKCQQYAAIKEGGCPGLRDGDS